MSWASVTYVFSPSTTAKSSEVNQNFTDLVNGLDTAMPSGGVIIWHSSIASIPSGFYLCNGSNSTIDLRNRFVICAGDTYSVGATGGNTTKNMAHTHSFSATSSSDGDHAHDRHESGGHSPDHGFDNGNYFVGASSPRVHTHTVSGTSGSGGSSTQDVMNPYFGAVFMQKS